MTRKIEKLEYVSPVCETLDLRTLAEVLTASVTGGSIEDWSEGETYDF